MTATVAGSAGNTLEDTITRMSNSIPMIASVTNKNAFTNGSEAETKEERRERFTEFINSRSKGTKDAIRYGVMNTSGVAGCYVDDSQTGVIKIYAHDYNGNLSDFLKSTIERNVEEYRCAGIPAFVFPASKVLIDVDVTIGVLHLYNSDAFKNYIQEQLSYHFFPYYVLGQDFMLSDLNAFIRNLDGIAIKNCKINSPSSDIEVSKQELVMVRNININLVDYID